MLLKQKYIQLCWIRKSTFSSQKLFILNWNNNTVSRSFVLHITYMSLIPGTIYSFPKFQQEPWVQNQKHVIITSRFGPKAKIKINLKFFRLYFFGFDLRAYPLMFRDYYWLGTQKSNLLMLTGTFGMSGIEHRLLTWCKASILVSTLSCFFNFLNSIK